MLSPVERRDLIWKALDRLHALAKEVAEGTHWHAGPEAAGAHVGGYVERLLAHLTRADERSSQSELRLLQAYHQNQTTWTEEEASVVETTDAHPDFPYLVPEFFEAACVHDKAEGTLLSRAMLDAILGICDVYIEVDYGVDAREYLLRTEIESVLLAACEK